MAARAPDHTCIAMQLCFAAHLQHPCAFTVRPLAGPTEASVLVTAFPFSEYSGNGSTPIGRCNLYGIVLAS